MRSRYTGLRPGELHALKWCDVDLQAHTISISKSYDRATSSAKAPKTSQSQRLIPIHENLLPVLKAARGEADESVAPMFSMNDDRFAPTFRAHLTKAKINRPRLSADNATEEPIDFRSLRDSYATWLALVRTPDRVIQRRMGHASASTTDRYIKAAESLNPDAIGVPFPPLPKALWTRVWPRNGKTPAGNRGLSVARARDWTFLTAAKAASRSVGCASLDR